MYTLIAENKYGQQLELTHNDAYVIESIDGIDPPDAVINTTKNANADGSVFNSSYVSNRQIIITLAINGPAEDNRIQLYRYFKNKYPVRLYYKNGSRDVYIDGYVKQTQIEFFQRKQIAQITIICPQPYFNGVEDSITDFSTVESLFEFPFSVEEHVEEGDDYDGTIEFSRILINEETNVINAGDIDTGALIELRAVGAVVNPVIYNVDTGEFFKITVTMAAGDVIRINTVRKEKSVYIISQGVKTNLIGNLVYGSTWLQFVPGDNTILIDADTTPENMLSEICIVNRFEGV